MIFLKIHWKNNTGAKRQHGAVQRKIEEGAGNCCFIYCHSISIFADSNRMHSEKISNDERLKEEL